MDFVTEIKGPKMRDIEFQTTKLTIRDQIRFSKYALYMKETWKMDSDVIVITTEDEPSEKVLRISENFVHKIKIYSLRNIDGDKIINKITDKVNNNEKLTLDEYIDLVIIGYYGSEDKVRNIKKSVEILTNIKDETQDMEKLITFQYMMFNKFVRIYDELEKIEGEFEMRLPAFERSLKREREQERLCIARNMLNKGVSIETIKEYIDLTTEQINSL